MMSDNDSTGSVLRDVQSIVPALSQESHKGQSGRIGIIGGCREYTGAPYYAAYSALRVGADLSYVFCTSDAAPVIKSYSPELIVYPILGTEEGTKEIIETHLQRLHAIVIGPGLGRSEPLQKAVTEIIGKIRELNLPMVLDADAVHLVSLKPKLLQGYQKAILTPNIREFERLYEAVLDKKPDSFVDPGKLVHNLSLVLGGVTILRKGPIDYVSDGESVLQCKEEGSPRRCGGQGDLMAGSLGTFTHWAHQHHNKQATLFGPTLLACMAAAMLTRRCNWLGFERMGRNMLLTDMIQQIRPAFTALFGD